MTPPTVVWMRLGGAATGAVLALVATAVLVVLPEVPATAARQVCPPFSSAGLQYSSETIGSGFTCATAKRWVLKLSKEPVAPSFGRVALRNGPKGYHCYGAPNPDRHASVGSCYRGKAASPKSVFLWNGSTTPRS
jgi:hypothetical protein